MSLLPAATSFNCANGAEAAHPGPRDVLALGVVDPLWREADVTAGTVSFEIVAVAKPDDANVIVGQAHFIKTVDDLHEALVGVSAQIRFGVAFCEASGARLVRASGNDDELVGIATADAQAIGAGHSFVVLLRNGFPVNVLNPIKAVPEVCTIYCATANPLRAAPSSPLSRARTA